jgi:iron complex outermembrane recepter protein
MIDPISARRLDSEQSLLATYNIRKYTIAMGSGIAMRINRLFSVAGLATLGGTLLLGRAVAEPPADTVADGALQEIVVTAEKRASTVQETAISMTAISGDELLKHGTQTVEQLVGNVPGISMRTAGPGQSEYEMRGLGANGGSQATVGFYLDDILLASSAASQSGRTVIDPDLFDLNHVEVLRGPQGTLYGAGSMGGTVKLVTNEPKLGIFEGSTAVNASQTSSGGSTNGSGNLMLNLPLGEIAALRVVLTDKYISGWIDRKVVGDFPFPTGFGTCNSAFYHCTRGDLLNATVDQTIKGSNLERFAGAHASLLVAPTDALKMTANLMYQRIDADGYNAFQYPPGQAGGYAIYQPYDTQEPYYDQFKLASLTVKYDAGFAELTSATSYWQRESVQSQDTTEGLQNVFNLTQFIPNTFYEYDPSSQFAEELRLVSAGSGPLQWVTGLFFTNLHSGYRTVNQNPAFANASACVLPYAANNCPPGGTYSPTNGGPSANPEGILYNVNNPNGLKQEAIYGQATYKLRPDLSLTGGLRFYRFDIAGTSSAIGAGTATGNGTATVGSESGSGSGVLPKIDLSYTPTRDLTIYSTIAKGARPGGVNDPIPLSTSSYYYCGPGSGSNYLTEQKSYYGPDGIWSYEIGEKARFADRRIMLNADVFYVQWNNIQELFSLTCGYNFSANAGKAKSYGPEIEFSAGLTDNLILNLSGAYTQAFISNPSTTVGLTLEPGTRINNIPRYTGSASLDYDREISNDYRLTARLNEAYVGQSYDVAYFAQDLPGYGLLDARVGVGRSNGSLSLFGTNLANKRAILSIDNTIFGWQQPDLTRATTNQPRTIGIEYQTKF